MVVQRGHVFAVVAVATAISLMGCNQDLAEDDAGDQNQPTNQSMHFACHLHANGTSLDEDVQAVFENLGENQSMNFIADLIDEGGMNTTEVDVTLRQLDGNERRRLLGSERRLFLGKARQLFGDLNVTNVTSGDISNMPESDDSSGVAVLINPDEGGFHYGDDTIVAVLCNGTLAKVADCRFALAGSENSRRLWYWHAVFYGTILVAAVVGATIKLGVKVADNYGAFGHRRRSCFPSNAQVDRGRQLVEISELQVGDIVSTSQGQSPYFLSGHHDPDAVTEMIQVWTSSNHSVTASPDHYFALADGTYAAAQHLAVGSHLWVQSSHGFSPSPIVHAHRVTARGEFNPFTVSGDIVVNGVLVSCHSSWFLEDYMQDAQIVPFYAALFAPLAVLYSLHPRWFKSFYKRFASSPLALHDHGAWNITSTAISTLFE